MKKFILKTILVGFSFFALYSIGMEVFFYANSYQTVNHIFDQDWLRIKERIEASQREIKNDTLYVGCSVAGQLLPFNDSNYLTSNGSIYAAGNYFLIKNSILKNKNINTVIYVSLPDIIGHEIARNRTYNYFVKPFYTFENREEIMSSDIIKNTLKRNPLLPLCLFDSFKILQLDDFNYSDGVHKRSDSLSVESMEWLIKTKSLCEKNDVNLYLASPPVAKSRLEATSNWEIIKNQVRSTELEEMFNNYFNTIIYVDDEHLRDAIHWKNDFIKQNRTDFLRKINNHPSN